MQSESRDGLWKTAVKRCSDLMVHLNQEIEASDQEVFPRTGSKHKVNQ